MKLKLCGLLVLSLCVFHIEALSIRKAKTDILPSKEVCGTQLSTENGVFPWVAFIPVESRIHNPTAEIRCTGTLINKRYVIVNKSCLQFVMNKVHLGQYDTTKDDNVLKIDIESRVVDDKYDIVLLRLAKDVEFTDHIKPICLPFEEFKKPETGSVVFTSGYGLKSYQGENSKTRKKVEHVLVSNEDCQKAKTEPRVSYNAFCVKLKDTKAVPACNGDEGSPVMYSDNGKYVLQGILVGLFENGAQPCVVNEPAIGFKITDEIVQWMVDKMQP